ncbi:MAG: hypothetical protein DSM106950_00235 [Stigonema ocellatum SAG 48.90 = DSM 106950]|nr:hypothetical protein [Stigonema ocellatum SAG 48.90 = DSM 106950]
MNTKHKSWNWQLWLTSFIATSGVCTYFGSSAFAQNAGTITVDTSNLIILGGNSTSISSSPGAIAGGSIINPGSILNPSGSVGGASSSGSAGNITISATPLILTRPVPEQTSTLGLLTFAAFSAALVLCKQKNRQIHIN